MGATIALEMAHRLIAMGREVGLLVVFDGQLLNTRLALGGPGTNSCGPGVLAKWRGV